METKFTKGPLRVDIAGEPESPLYWYVQQDDNKPFRGTLASFQSAEHIGGTTREETLANALLYAAAPDLYAALVAVISVADRKTIEFDAAHAALAKARGE